MFSGMIKVVDENNIIPWEGLFYDILDPLRSVATDLYSKCPASIPSTVGHTSEHGTKRFCILLRRNTCLSSRVSNGASPSVFPLIRADHTDLDLACFGRFSVFTFPIPCVLFCTRHPRTIEHNIKRGNNFCEGGGEVQGKFS